MILPLYKDEAVAAETILEKGNPEKDEEGEGGEVGAILVAVIMLASSTAAWLRIDINAEGQWPAKYMVMCMIAFFALNLCTEKVRKCLVRYSTKVNKVVLPLEGVLLLLWALYRFIGQDGWSGIMSSMRFILKSAFANGVSH